MSFIVRRLVFYLVAAWVALTINFFIPRLMPGNAVESIMSKFPNLQPSAYRALAGRLTGQPTGRPVRRPTPQPAQAWPAPMARARIPCSTYVICRSSTGPRPAMCGPWTG